MPQGDKRKYTDKQKRKARHIEQGYEQRGVGKSQAAGRAWATVNAESGGGEKRGGSGYGKAENHRSSARGGKVSQAKRTPAQRSAAAQKGAATRKRNAAAGQAAHVRAGERAHASHAPA